MHRKATVWPGGRVGHASPSLGPQQDRLRRIAELIDLRDQLRLVESALAGGANAKGMMMHAPERKQAWIEAGDWVMAALGSPADVLLKGLLGILKAVKKRPEILAELRDLADTTEEMAFWVKQVQTLGKAVQCGNPIGLAALAVTSIGSYGLKRAGKKAANECSDLEAAMEELWSMSQDYRRQLREVRHRLDREISLLR